MTRTWAIVLLATYTVALAFAVQAHSQPSDNLVRAATAIRQEFGVTWAAGCMLRIAQRETGGTFDPRAANWADRHADGSVGSFGLFQIGALWRRLGEPVAAFARRMFDLEQNVALAHSLYMKYGVGPWGGC